MITAAFQGGPMSILALLAVLSFLLALPELPGNPSSYSYLEACMISLI